MRTVNRLRRRLSRPMDRLHRADLEVDGTLDTAAADDGPRPLSD